MRDLKCSCVGCDNLATHTWSGHPTCDSCGSPSRINKTSKPFDITKHDFSDWEISSADFEYGEFTLRFFEVNAIHLNKSDAIAIAMALGVTGGDLK